LRLIASIDYSIAVVAVEAIDYREQKRSESICQWTDLSNNCYCKQTTVYEWVFVVL
jgi:hypothetical protein